ncbi:uncharacterized protein JN550_013700 [Neoarthrinium moseri]|uniref:uncharacterized protein n=1 Tax=Neoarthrinium moseri TaxID=1658444 RepID=UPI001FDC52C7|nr:uncharacterized protein JN550_013700 [Neoarthrinium moseri]KAI1856706.1 hypothetical protein JN550_013700 [Neoarthrinium moseri]
MPSSTPPKLPDLYVNDGQLPLGMTGLLKPTDPYSASVAEMRESLARDGYLFLKGLLPREDVLRTRERYFDMLSPTGILKPGTSEMDGIFDASKDPGDYPGFGTGKPGTGTALSDQFMTLALQSHSQSWYKDDFCKHPAMISFVEKLTGWGKNTGSLDRTLLRNNVPGNKAIGVHYDYIFLRHGDDSVITAWIPIGDVEVEGGGLIYLEKGHELGKHIEHEFTQSAISSGMTEEQARSAFNTNMMSGGVLDSGPISFGTKYQRRWLVSAYEAGDVVLHNSYMIHASTMNYDKENRIRLGTDLRFVDTSKVWDTRWAKVYEDGDGL